MDHGGFNIGGFAGSGDKCHAVGQSLAGPLGIPLDKGIQLFKVCDDLIQMDDGNMD